MSQYLKIPIFPLPHVVFFPKTLLPLHIFEARYRKMVAQALEGNQLIGMVLLISGGESSHAPEDAHSVGCVGRIHKCEQLEDGCYNVVLLGLSKFQIREYSQMEPYRIAVVETREETPVEEVDVAVIGEKNRLLAMATKVAKQLAEVSEEQEGKADFLNARLSYEAVVNNLVHMAHLDAGLKQQLLEMDSLRERGRLLLDLLLRQGEALEMFRRYRHLVPADPNRN